MPPLVFLVRSTHNDLQHIIRQWQLLRLIPRGATLIQTSRSSSVVRITGIAFGWMGSTTAAGRKLGRGLDHFRKESCVTLVPPPTEPDPYEDEAYRLWQIKQQIK